jgi:hypothetical protein
MLLVEVLLVLKLAGGATALLALVFGRGGLEALRKRRDELVAECDRLAEVYRRGTGDNPAL